MDGIKKIRKLLQSLYVVINTESKTAGRRISKRYLWNSVITTSLIKNIFNKLKVSNSFVLQTCENGDK